MAVAATGFFDGVHLGHRAVIETLLNTASGRGEQSLVLTFWPHPRAVLRNGARDLRLLTSQEEKAEMLRGLGVDRVEVLPFSSEFSSMTAGQYLQMLKEKYGVTAIVLGYDNRFGSDGLSTESVAALAESMGLTAEVVPPYKAVSSTMIRKALASGDVEGASEMLGYGYELRGVVVSGNMMGRTIGFPTANMKLREPLKAIPKAGVYTTDVTVDGRHFRGMTNIDANEKIETHILDFNEDIYGLDISIRFRNHLRDEKHFDSFEELKLQIIEDVRCAGFSE